MGHRAAVLGASGYAGGELVRLLDAHPSIDLVHLGAHAKQGLKLAEAHPQLAGGDRLLGSVDAEAVPEVDVAFLALPPGGSAEPGARLAARGVLVIDLGSDFRLDTPGRYLAAYGRGHPLPEELGKWAYGLPELFPDELASATKVAVPGCYPTAALLALAPLLQAGLIAPQGVVVQAASGVSGAGRALREDLLFGSVDEGVRAYGLAGHRHRPEIEMALDRLAPGEHRVAFIPHLVPMQRGLLATCTAPLASGTGRSDLEQALAAAYHSCRFVEVVDQPPQTRWVVGSNRALVAAFVDLHSDTAIVLCAIDNLLKGAAGQAVQAANLLLGLDEAAGLPLAGWMP